MPAKARPDEHDTEMFNLVTGRAMEALSKDPRGLDAALKADPVEAAVSYGVKALWTVADAAEQAGSFDLLRGDGRLRHAAHQGAG